MYTTYGVDTAGLIYQHSISMDPRSRLHLAPRNLWKSMSQHLRYWTSPVRSDIFVYKILSHILH